MYYKIYWSLGFLKGRLFIMKHKKNNYYWWILSHNRFFLIITVLLNVIASITSVFVAIFLQRIVDQAIDADKVGFVETIVHASLYLLIVTAIYYTYSFFSKKLLKRVTTKLRENVFMGIFRRNYKDFHESNTADYISILTNDVKLVEENYLTPLLSIIEYTASFIATLVLLIKLNLFITGILIISMIIMFLIPGTIGTLLQKKQSHLSNQFAIFTSKIKDLFSGFEVIHSFHLISHINKEFKEQNTELSSVKYKADLLFSLNNSVSEFLAMFTQIITIFIAAYFVMLGNITTGTLLAIIQLSGNFVVPLVMIMQNFPKIQSISPVLSRMEEICSYQDNTGCNLLTPSFENRIMLSNVSFAYHKDQPVLKDIYLMIEKGKKYAIVGESGCGKSTLIKLLLGYYKNYTGTITYDETDIGKSSEGEISKLASVIHQNVYMFDKTIKDNICLYNEYSDEELENALKLSEVAKFLPDTEEQINTKVGENGANLSGGQRQRIAIARAVIKNTPILILDEGTSAVDLQTAKDIEHRLIQNKHLTLITITHKINEEVLNQYDQIIHMDKGKIKNIGTYSELYAAKEEFYNFCIGTN